LAYCDAQNPNRHDAFPDLPDGARRANVIELSRKLGRLGNVAPFLPLLLAVRIRFPGDVEAYRRAVELSEVFAFRVYRLARRRADAGQGELFATAHAVFAGKAGIQDALDRLRDVSLEYCSSHEFERELTEPRKNWYDWQGLKYFFYEYEQHLAESRGDAVQLPWNELSRRYREQSIEHVLPQTPTDIYWASRFSENQIAEYLHDLGNLCLTGHNTSYGNRPFPEKKGEVGSSHPCYANSNLFMERELAGFTDWTPEVVQRRRETLIQWATRRWGLDGQTAQPAEVAVTAVTSTSPVAS
ncbi:MAG: HNH endonuclease family protein, partial [Actinobacteria bacterium]|nr:HNH endonuclease family protein [Actinomycetota bacterium]